MRTSIYVTEPIHDDALALLRKHADVDVGSDSIGRSEILARVAPAETILSKTDPVIIDAELMAAAPRLRMVARHGTGYSNVDIDHATANGIAVTVTAGANIVAVSEYTVGMMLTAARCLPQASAACAKGAPERHNFAGVQISGKTFGIIGVGRIGRAVVERVAALGMRVLAYHPRPSAKDLVDLPLQLVDLETLLQESDVVSLHVPLKPDTTNLINARELAMMKPQAILLNLSRGGVVNENALYEALSHDHIFGAATDVLAHEPVRADEPLLGLSNCIVLPHIAAMTFESQREIAMTAAGQCLEVLAGRVPQYIVNPDALKHAKWEHPS